MQLEKFISPLLFRYSCVVVPGFGAFLTHEKGASHHEKTNTFYPPTKQLSFNAQLKVGDGILVAHIAATLGKSYEDALDLLKEAVVVWNTSLVNGNAIELEGIGVLHAPQKGKILFTPNHQFNYLPASFGLAAVKALPIINHANKANAPLPEKNFQINATHKNPQNLKRFFLRYAAAGLIGVSGVLSVYRSYNLHLSHKIVAQQEAGEVVQQKLQEATFFGNNPLSLSPLEISIAKAAPAKPSFFIIAGAFRAPENASKKIAQLQSNGFKHASYLGANRYGLHQVSYASFVSESDARAFLKDIQRNHAKDAWLLVSKNK